MSRTFKTKPSKFKYESYTKDYIKIPGTWHHIWCKTTKTKKRKEVDTEDHWMGSGPSWFKNMFMNRPQRYAGRTWEKTVLREVDIEDTDPPGVSHKPHVYFY